jgi:hypothetical protein
MRVENLLEMRRQSKPSAFVEGDNQNTRVDRVDRGRNEEL